MILFYDKLEDFERRHAISGTLMKGTQLMVSDMSGGTKPEE